MAFKTQIRVGQLTGSIGTAAGQVNDQLIGRTASGSLIASDLSDIFSSMAGSIKRIHGADSFSEQYQGQFKAVGGNTPFHLTGSGIAANQAFEIETAAGDIVLDPAGNNVVPGGDSEDDLGVAGTAWRKLFVDDIMLAGQGRIDLDADADTSIRSPGDDIITFEAAGVDIMSIAETGVKIVDDKALVFGDGNDVVMEYDEDGVDRFMISGAAWRFADDQKLEFGAGGDVSIEYDEDGDDVLQIAGGNVRIGHGAVNALQFRDSTLTLNSPTDGTLAMSSDNLLVLDAQGTDSGDGITLQLGTDTADTKVMIKDNSGNIRHQFDAGGGATITGDMIINGNLDVNGQTTTIDTANMAIEDGIIGLGTSGSTGYAPATADRGFVFGAGAKHVAQAVFYHGGSGDDRFHLGLSLTGPTSASFATPTAYKTLRLGQVELGGANDRIRLDTDLFVDAAADIVLDAAGGNVKPASDDQCALGVAGTGFSDLFLASGAVMNFANGDVALTHAAGKLTLSGDGAVEVDFGNHEMTNVDIDSGAIDGAVIGGASAAAGTFTALQADDSLVVNANASIVGDAAGEIQLNVAAHASQSTSIFNVELQDGTDKLTVSNVGVTTAASLVATVGQIGTLNGAMDCDNQNMTNVDIDSGAIDGAIIGAASAAAGTFTALDCNDGAFAVANLDIDGATDIGAALVDADLIMVDDGAGGTNRKAALSRLKTYLKPQKFSATRSAVLNANVDLDTGFGSAWTGATAAQRDVYVNGQLLLEGANAAANADWYPGGSDGRVKFEFALQVGDVVQAILRMA